RSGGDPGNDGVDTDRDGLCDAGDGDLDNDGVANAADADPLDPHVCRDLDGDGCDDCTRTGADQSGGDVSNDGIDHDRDGDGDSCDDCGLEGPDESAGAPDHDGVDTDHDGLCDRGDDDLDGDGVPNAADPSPADPQVCGDADGDGCDDCGGCPGMMPEPGVS